MTNVLAAAVLQDLKVSWRRRAGAWTALLFFVATTSLFPFAIGPDPQVLRALAPGVVWVSALLASMLTASHLFTTDYRDGSLDQLLLSPHPLALLVLGRVLAHWLTSGVPLLVATPLLAHQYGLPFGSGLALAATLLLGTPVLALVGAFGAALTLGLRGGAMLLCVLALPLCVPVLVFGADAGAAADAGRDCGAQIALLGAFLAASLFLCPLGAAAGLRITME